MLSFIMPLFVSIFGTSMLSIIFKKRFEIMLPIYFMFSALFVYVLTVFNLFDVAIYLLLLFSCICLIYLIYCRVKKRKQLNDIIKYIFTPGLIIYFMIYIFVFILNYNRGFNTWDEFSHWADTVKIMTYLDDFATAPDSPALFKSYPPAMSLLQYFVQKNKMWIKGDNLFTDWRLYLAYHVFEISMLFPCLDREEKAYKKAIKLLVLVFICVLFYTDMLEYLYIDPFVAIMGGYVFLSAIMKGKKDGFDFLGICLACACLTLAKDIGLYFALAVGILYLADSCDYSVKKFFSLHGLYGFIPASPAIRQS